MDILPILSTLRRHRMAATLIVLEIAVTCAIVCNAIFLIRDRVSFIAQPSGLVEDEIVRLQVTGVGQSRSTGEAYAITAQDLTALRAIPGVRSAAVTNMVPMAGSSWNVSVSNTEDPTVPSINCAFYIGSEELLETWGVQLTGRDFTPDEYVTREEARAGAKMTTTIITRGVADRFFPGESALGKIIYQGANHPMRVIGVIEQLARPNRFQDRVASKFAVVSPVRLSYDVTGNYLLRVEPARRAEVLAAAGRVLDSVDPNRVLLERQTFADIRESAFAQDRSMAWLLGVVTVLLLVITALGVVGLASFWVQQRTRQIGIRRALGASRGDILRYFQTENFLLVTIGIVVGMALAYAINLLLMRSYQVERLSAAYLPAGAALLWVLGQVAVLGPALRASLIPPAIATRSV